jgi:hypothetical protein
MVIVLVLVVVVAVVIAMILIVKSFNILISIPLEICMYLKMGYIGSTLDIMIFFKKGKKDMKELIKEKQMVFQDLIDIMNEGLSSEDSTSEVLGELRDKISEILKNDF